MAAVVPPEPTQKPKGTAPRSKTRFKWLRRITAVAVNIFFLHWILTGSAGLASLSATVSPAQRILPDLSPAQILLAALVIWYAVLTELKLRWVVWLPFYLLFSPLCYLVLTIGRMVMAPPIRKLRNMAEASDTAVAATFAPKRKLPLRRLWVFGFFLWLIVLRTVSAAWAAWLLPALMIPIWWWFLKLAYRAATTPATFVDLALQFSRSMLESVVKQFDEAAKKGAEPDKSTRKWAFAVVRMTLNRYSAERLLVVVNREALLLFSVALVMAIGSSAVFWALVGRAVTYGGGASLDAYHFFSSGRFPEFVLWAFGCMTTSIAFPGVSASVPLKAMHAAILLTGVFQLTYLLACFSIMASAEGERTVKRAAGLIEEVGSKFERARLLGIEAQPAIEVPGPPAPPRSD